MKISLWNIKVYNVQKNETNMYDEILKIMDELKLHKLLCDPNRATSYINLKPKYRNGNSLKMYKKVIYWT